MDIGKAVDLFALFVMVSGLAIMIAQTIYYGSMFILPNIAPCCILLLGGTIALLNEGCDWGNGQ